MTSVLLLAADAAAEYSGHFPVDTPLIISQKSDKNLHLMLEADRARLRVYEVFPPDKDERNIARLYFTKGGYNVRFGHEYMCSKVGQVSVRPCNGDQGDDDAVWDIISTGEGTIFKIRGKCLTMGPPDVESGSFVLFVKDCHPDLSQLFEIREVPILPLDWPTQHEMAVWKGLDRVTTKSRDTIL